MREDGSAALCDDTKELLKLAIHFPLENKSLENVCHAKIVYSVLLSMGHIALTYLNAHIKSINYFCSQWGTVETMYPANQPTKGVYHLQYLSLRLTKYWRDQSMSDLNKKLPMANALMEKIESGENWEPRMSHALEASI